MSEGPEERAGIWASARTLLDTVLATVQNRVELFAVELQEEKCRWIEALLCATAVAAFGMMALSLITFTIVIVFWDNGRLPALIGLTALYLIGTGLAWRALQVRLRARSTFSASLDELKEDRSCLTRDN